MTWENNTFEEDNKKFEFEKPEAGKEKFMAFMATSVSTIPSVSFDDKTNQDVIESETKHDWKAEYQLLFAKSMKMLKMNEKVGTS